MITDIWKVHGFEIMLLFFIIVTLIFMLSRIGKDGSYTDLEYYDKLVGFLPISVTANNKKTKTDSKPELLCRKVLENYFNVSFSKARPNFLKNPVFF